MIQNLILSTLMTLTINIRPLAIASVLTLTVENDTFINNAYISQNYRNTLRMGSSGYQNINNRNAKMVAYRYSVSQQYYVRDTETYFYENYGAIIRKVELDSYTPNYLDNQYRLLYSNLSTLPQNIVGYAWGEILPSDFTEIKQAVQNLVDAYEIGQNVTVPNVADYIKTLINRADDWSESYTEAQAQQTTYNGVLEYMQETLDGTKRFETDNYTQTYEDQENGNIWYAVQIMYTKYGTEQTNNSVSKAYEQLFTDMGKGIEVSYEYDYATVVVEEKPIDIAGLMFTILGMPFAWISTAFNFTLWPDTMYAINVGHTLLGIVFLSFAIWIIKRVLK